MFWAIIDNRCAFFNQVLIWDKVQGSSYANWSMSNLDDILINIKHIQPISKANFLSH